MKSSPEPRTIGDLAAEAGVDAHVLRHWESVGLLQPDRVNGRRVYTDDDAYRVAAIRRGKAAQLSLEQLRQIIAASDPAERTVVLQQQRDLLERKAADIAEAITMINCVLDCDHEDFTQCPNFRAFVTGEPTHNPAMGVRQP